MANQSSDWYGQQLVSEDVPLVDASEGRAIVLRDFRYAMTPNFIIPSKQMIFNSHWPKIKELLWADGLEPNEDHLPRVVIGKFAYHIFIVCELTGGKFRKDKAKDKAKSLQDIFDKPKK